MKLPVWLTRSVGLVGALLCAILFWREPSWPTPDKLLVFLTLSFMALGQGWELFKRLGPFVGLLLVYESFRGIADKLNTNVNFMFMPAVDTLGNTIQLPTVWLQKVMWHGSVSWYDFVFYGAYMLHFVLPIALAIAIWKLRPKLYWQYVTTFVLVSFAAFLTFLLFPAAPPWMASEQGLIPSITRISSQVWAAFGIQDFPSIYNRISPNPVAAMPSLHAAYAALFCAFIWRVFGKKWAALASIYPFLIWFGTVYQGEHYAIDELAGIAYAAAAFVLAPKLIACVQNWLRRMLYERITRHLVPVFLTH